LPQKLRETPTLSTLTLLLLLLVVPLVPMPVPLSRLVLGPLVPRWAGAAACGGGTGVFSRLLLT
jgi:hypothetical protein